MFLFVNCNHKATAEFIMNRVRPKLPPFGIAYLSSILKRSGFSTCLHDDILHEFDDDGFRHLFRHYKSDLEAIGITSVCTTLRQLGRVARIAKEIAPDIPVIVGGPHARLLPHEIIAIPEVDVVFTSEAELSIVDYARKRPLNEIPSIIYRHNGKYVENTVKTYVKNLDDIPFPDYDLFNISDYHITKGIAKRHPNSYIMTSRGCPHKCTFCSEKAFNPTEGKIVRFRSPENVVAEIEMVEKKYGVKEIFFSDDMFTANASHLMGICNGIISKKLKVIWLCMTHVNNIDPEKLRLMKKAGCHQICFGVESGDKEIQKEINKNLDFARVHEAVKMTQRAGIDVRCSFMFGNQKETPATMEKTIRLALSLKSDFASLSIATPYPGTYLRDWAIQNNYLKNTAYEALDGTSYAMVTPDLPPGTVERYINKAYRAFYYSPSYMMRRLKHIRDFEDLKRFCKSVFYAFQTIPYLLGKILHCR